MAILAAQPDVISVDVVAAKKETYHAVAGFDGFDASRAGLDVLIAASRKGWDESGGLPKPWIVPRITRCDAVRDEIEGVFDAGLLACGACVIDPIRAHELGTSKVGRIGPIPVPPAALNRLNAITMRIALAEQSDAIASDGTSVAGAGGGAGVGAGGGAGGQESSMELSRGERE